MFIGTTKTVYLFVHHRSGPCDAIARLNIRAGMLAPMPDYIGCRVVVHDVPEAPELTLRSGSAHGISSSHSSPDDESQQTQEAPLPAPAPAPPPEPALAKASAILTIPAGMRANATATVTSTAAGAAEVPEQPSHDVTTAYNHRVDGVDPDCYDDDLKGAAIHVMSVGRDV